MCIAIFVVVVAVTVVAVHVVVIVVVVILFPISFTGLYEWGRGEHWTPSIILVSILPSFKIPNFLKKKLSVPPLLLMYSMSFLGMQPSHICLFNVN